MMGSSHHQTFNRSLLDDIITEIKHIIPGSMFMHICYPLKTHSLKVPIAFQGYITSSLAFVA